PEESNPFRIARNAELLDRADRPARVGRLVLEPARRPTGAAQREIAGGEAILDVLHLAGSQQMLERIVIAPELRERQAQPAQHDQRGCAFLKPLAEEVGGVGEVALAILALSGAKVARAQGPWQTRPPDREGEDDPPPQLAHVRASRGKGITH